MPGRAKARGIPVFYFVPPQIWAWGGWRVRKVRKYVDQVLCSFRSSPPGITRVASPTAVHVGHPYFDELADRPLDGDFLAEQNGRPGSLVAILPGSRTQEVVRNLPDMVRAASEAGSETSRRSLRCCLPARAPQGTGASKSSRGSIAGEGPSPGLAIEVHAGRTPELIRLARVAWAVSGSVGLELMVEALPSVVLYKVKRFDLWVARWFIKSKYISLVNLLADAEVFPEYLTWRDVSDELVRWAIAWLDDSEARARATASLLMLRHHVARPGASDRAAERIVAWLRQHRQVRRRPWGTHRSLPIAVPTSTPPTTSLPASPSG